MIPVLTTEPFVGLRGPGPGSELARNQQNPLTIDPFSNDLLAQAKVSPEVVWGGTGTRFPRLERELNEVGTFISALIHRLTCAPETLG